MVWALGRGRLSRSSSSMITNWSLLISKPRRTSFHSRTSPVTEQCRFMLMGCLWQGQSERNETDLDSVAR